MAMYPEDCCEQESMGAKQATLKKEPLINSEVNRLHRGMNDLEEMISCLREKLRPILRDEPCSEGGEGKQQPALPVPLAAEIATINWRMAGIRERIQVLLSQVEV